MAGPKNASRKLQAPKGTRDFYPQDMAVRRYIESVWRKVSINHGFDEVEGPMFEDIELYKHKSGPGIVSEIFQVFSGKDQEELGRIRGGGEAPFALRPEFTPTLARMVAAKAAELPRPIKWFAIPQHFRAERPQRGRLREFMQWNVDFIGDDSPRADAEVIATAIAGLQELGIQSKDVTIHISHRELIAECLQKSGVDSRDIESAMALLDKRTRLKDDQFALEAKSLGLDAGRFDLIARESGEVVNQVLLAREEMRTIDVNHEGSLGVLMSLIAALDDHGVMKWCEFDFSIVRGLAYYTGTVFEIHESTGAERAIAGGGRYDNLIESFGGPSLPACGFGMGDVVLANILHDKNLLSEDVYMKPLRPHAFAIAATDDAEPTMRQIVAQLRREGFHVRHSYKSTRNVGKLLGDANKSRAMSAIIFGNGAAAGHVDFKDLQSGEQESVQIAAINDRLRQVVTRNP